VLHVEIICCFYCVSERGVLEMLIMPCSLNIADCMFRFQLLVFSSMRSFAVKAANQTCIGVLGL